jgi:hypothetical protein
VDSISPITAASPNSAAQTADLLSASGDPLAASFTDLMNDLLTPNLPQSSSPGPSEAQILAQQSNEEFLQKLALLSSMMEQAQTVMDAQKPLPGGLPNPAAQNYYFFRSELSQVGLPGAVPDVV